MVGCVVVVLRPGRQAIRVLAVGRTRRCIFLFCVCFKICVYYLSII